MKIIKIIIIIIIMVDIKVKIIGGKVIITGINKVMDKNKVIIYKRQDLEVLYKGVMTYNRVIIFKL